MTPATRLAAISHWRVPAPVNTCGESNWCTRQAGRARTGRSPWPGQLHVFFIHANSLESNAPVSEPQGQPEAHGARIAMELDINPEWVQLDAAGIPGGALTAEIPGQYRPSDQYLAGWTRDFFTVLAPSPSPPGIPLPSARIRP